MDQKIDVFHRIFIALEACALLMLFMRTSCHLVLGHTWLVQDQNYLSCEPDHRHYRKWLKKYFAIRFRDALSTKNHSVF